MKKCPASLATWEVQVQAAWRVHLRKTKSHTCKVLQGGGGTLEHCWSECKLVQLQWESAEASSKHCDQNYHVIQPHHGLYPGRNQFATEMTDSIMLTKALFILLPIAKLWYQFMIKFYCISTVIISGNDRRIWMTLFFTSSPTLNNLIHACVCWSGRLYSWSCVWRVGDWRLSFLLFVSHLLALLLAYLCLDCYRSYILQICCPMYYYINFCDGFYSVELLISCTFKWLNLSKF